MTTTHPHEQTLEQRPPPSSRRAPPSQPPLSERSLQRELGRLTERRLLPRPGAARVLDEIDDERRLRLLEESFVRREREAVAALAAEAPSEPAAFMDWFSALRTDGPGQGDSLFPWLANEASLEQVRWFLAQEVFGEAGFDDLVALTQIKMPERPKLELGRNYWDELGRGQSSGMHGPMLKRVVDTLELEKVEGEPIPEVLALANLLVALAYNRHYAYHSIGALGAIELTSTTRVPHVNAALKRLGVPAKTRQYFALHATLDLQHSDDWNREVIRPLVEEEGPEVARAIAEGALMRLMAGSRCFVRYRQRFGLGG